MHPPNGEWDSTADIMVQRFEETGHPVFKNINGLSRGILKRKKGEETIHFNGGSSNTEQLSIYGAVATWCEPFGLTEEEKGRDNLSVNKK